MIDAHCHLEVEAFDEDREEVIEKCKEKLQAVVTSCCHPKYLSTTLKMVESYQGFVFATASLHPLHVHEVGEAELKSFIEAIEDAASSGKLVGIGEVGLDFTVEDGEKRRLQEEIFKKFIRLAKQLNLPLVVHSRKAYENAIEVLESEGAREVLMHFFTERKLLPRVLDNGWFISVNTLILRNKTVRKLVRDCPLENILTETDSPWLGFEEGRNTPLAVEKVVRKIAEIKKLPLEKVDEITTENAKRFFRLKL